MKRLLLAFLAAVLFSAPTFALSDAQQTAISMHCDTIKNTLKTIQREDSRTRIAVGAIYETLLTRYITPLNLRLVANISTSPNLVTFQPDLVAFQSDFATKKSDFSAKFVEYSRSLEHLIATDCRDPEVFYSELEATRSLRAEVNRLATDLAASATGIQPQFEQLKEAL